MADVVLDVRPKPFVNARLVIRRILSLTVLLATGVAQAMSTACPMGIAGGGDHHPVVHFGSTPVAAHADHDAAAPSPAHHRVSRAGGAENDTDRASAPPSHAPVNTGVPCALTMSCAPLIAAASTPLGTPDMTADVASPSVWNHLLSPDTNAATPPPRPFV